MALKLHNTLTRRKEEFVPYDKTNVRMYVCGPTVYDFAHIGNARPVVVFDVLYRMLKRLYPRVTYVRNITDVDDKIIDAAKASSAPIDAITTRNTAAFHEDMAALGCLPPDVEPRATAHIAEMQALIRTLIQIGHAYVADGHVLFSVPSKPDYGKLSGRTRDEQIAGARVEVAPYKKDAADFVLWKPSTPEQPGWNSEWGRGRPGWHIECSAMSEKHLGVPFDIHGGGLDLVFPHHENEIAQSECAHDGAPFAKYWMHNGWLTVNGEKMSKSLGNFVTVRDVLDKYPRRPPTTTGETLRFLLIKTHYRSPIDFSDDAFIEAKSELDRLYRALREVDGNSNSSNEVLDAELRDALDDDLNTALAISRLHAIATELNKAATVDAKTTLGRILRASGGCLGLLQYDPQKWPMDYRLKAEPGRYVIGGGDDEEVNKLILERTNARKARDFKEADRIRNELERKGIVLEDTPQGTKWRRAG